ncbi:PTS cellobiose transporter subunit IIC [Rossellomorea sp. KS-H15a]|uniref:PTS cellobiose transporter subunit IIC n=1 Tax=Rossellomorea sp. KS-H15a TaxID=2963940 RepID=UPI0020C7165C|nr:PTS cellobiose transporter subunit IIC [Rossellomorea sp. KS-H15a]UTE77391.1 PTS cellobiose transporter subunit IIC [Rossellomorea sp. KS-H15a]
MSKVMGFMESKFMPVAGRIGSQRHLVAIRDGFVSIMPLIIVGSLAVLLNNLPIDAFQNFMVSVFGESWKSVGGNMWNGSFAILGLLVAASISYHLAKSYDIDGLAAALVSIASLIILTPVTEDWGISYAWTGAQGIFVAVITSILVTELFKVLIRSKFTISMPDGVPEGVMKSFKALIPATIILILIGLIQALLTSFAEKSLFEIVFTLIQEPLQAVSNSLPSAIVVAFLNHFLWFFGLHGTNILGPIIEPIYLPLIEKNQQLFAAGTSAFDVPYIVTKPFFDAYVYMGGSGTTIALIIAIFLVVKTKHYRTVGKLSAAPGIFNINEPVIFGLPIVLNPLMFIPFLLAPVVLTVTSYLALSLGIVPKTVAIVPWTTPPIISGYLVTGGSWTGIALQLVNLTIATLMYIPFLLASERAQLKKTNETSDKIA